MDEIRIFGYFWCFNHHGFDGLAPQAAALQGTYDLTPKARKTAISGSEWLPRIAGIDAYSVYSRSPMAIGGILTHTHFWISSKQKGQRVEQLRCLQLCLLLIFFWGGIGLYIIIIRLRKDNSESTRNLRFVNYR